MPSETFQPIQFGNYLLTSLIGRGGMAEVFKARARGAAGFERVVCVKRVLRNFSEDQHFLDMFVNEAKISARLSHPNIVQVFELGEVDGEFFMAMEFVNGRDLLRVIKANGDEGPLPPACSAYVAREMCRALAHAHEYTAENGQVHPIIHRDVSPQNVMVSFDGIVKLCDFGIAKATQLESAEETRTGALKGKFAYMAPEQLDGQRATPQSDIFAVGVTLHEMLTGRRLFKGTTDYETLVRVKTQPVPPPSSLNGKVPPELDRIVSTALQRDPALRYQRAGQMARDLEQYCATAGFGADEMKEAMIRYFPNRDEVPDGIAHVPSQTGGGSPSTRGARPRQRTQGGGTGAGTGAAPSTAAAGSGRGGLFALAGIALVVVLVLGGLVIAKQRGLLFASGPVSEKIPTAAVIPAAPATPSDDVQVVNLDSTPSGVEVTEGPRLLGTTPLALKMTDKKRSVAVRLSKKGFDDLDYTVTATDGPSLTLKLTPSKHHHGDGNVGAAGSGKGPKVQSFDEVDTKLKVKTIED